MLIINAESFYNFKFYNFIGDLAKFYASNKTSIWQHFSYMEGNSFKSQVMLAAKSYICTDSGVFKS